MNQLALRVALINGLWDPLHEYVNSYTLASSSIDSFGPQVQQKQHNFIMYKFNITIQYCLLFSKAPSFKYYNRKIIIEITNKTTEKWNNQNKKLIHLDLRFKEFYRI